MRGIFSSAKFKFGALLPFLISSAEDGKRRIRKRLSLAAIVVFLLLSMFGYCTALFFFLSLVFSVLDF